MPEDQLDDIWIPVDSNNDGDNDVVIMQSYVSLADIINESPDLRGNDAVSSAMDDARTIAEKDDKPDDDKKNDTKIDYDKIEDVFYTLGNTIQTFNNPQANVADCVSAGMNVVASVIKAIPGSKTITGPLGIVVKLSGSIIGVFGSIPSKTNKYYEAMDKLVGKYIGQLQSEQVNQDLAGALSTMDASNKHISKLLTRTYVDPAKELSNQGITVSKFVDIATHELGGAYKLMSDNLSKSSSSKWDNGADIAETFYMISEVVNVKAMYMLTGMAYFQLLEEQDGTYVSAQSLKGSLYTFKEDYYKKAEPYFFKPSIRASAITHWLYRLQRDKFDYMVAVYKNLREEKVVLWPDNANSYRFTCSKPDKHNVGKTSNGIKCARLTTLFATREDKDSKNRSLAKPGTTESNSKDWDNDKANGVPRFISNKDFDKKPYHTHFDMTPSKRNSSEKPPYYTWNLEAKNKHEESYTTYNGYMVPGTVHSKDFVYKDSDFYIFEVFPTDEEKSNSSKIWPNKWSHKPSQSRPYLMIGSNKKDRVWVTHHQMWSGSTDTFAKEKFYDIVYNSKHYGCPDQCMWYFLDEDEE